MEPRPSPENQLTIIFFINLRISITNPRPLTNHMDLQIFYELKIFHDVDTDNGSLFSCSSKTYGNCRRFAMESVSVQLRGKKLQLMVLDESLWL
jgi:hypothetical protein